MLQNREQMVMFNQHNEADFIKVMRGKVQVASRMPGPLRAMTVHRAQCPEVKQMSSQLENSQSMQPKENKNKHSELSMAAPERCHTFSCLRT